MSLPLAGRRIAVPESRQLDVLDGLLTRRGAEVVRCPLVTIVDAPDAAPVLAWLREFVKRPPDYLILVTGEGLARLRGFAESDGISEKQLRGALERTTIISRGPKPARELRHFGLVPELFAIQPTTPGVIELLHDLDLERCTVAVQLYGEDPNELLINYLNDRSATVTTVAPYRYAAQLSEESITALVADLVDHAFDAIIFTSMAQVKRLFDVASAIGLESKLKKGLEGTCVAAIGPVVVSVLGEFGCHVDVMPNERYFMKPLVQSLCIELDGTLETFGSLRR